eukprot:1147416-Pelagomonas_calceolata.AAC.9
MVYVPHSCFTHYALLNAAFLSQEWAYGASMRLKEIQQQLLGDQAYGLVKVMRQHAATGNSAAEEDSEDDEEDLVHEMVGPLKDQVDEIVQALHPFIEGNAW